jgi:hypothetical protein
MEYYAQLDGSGAIVGLFANQQPFATTVLDETSDKVLAFLAPVAAAPVGITIASTATPSLNGTYAIDDAAAAVISSIYAGIKGGDGLPGSGSTFNYADMGGEMHAFGETDFVNFAKAARDYRYALSQGETPTLPISIS